ncbi:MAG: NAD(P)-dependent dehydrogenase (short-subunit alcohol dehydrogenase family) [Bradymonadia bacterium]|jgi:NAD(P)-dependent dehydrogenase (short-subunit alcohol dehydrogenase family)
MTLALGSRGATVLMLCRSEQRAEEAVNGLVAQGVARENLEFVSCDLADLSSVAEAAQVLAARPRLDALVHNAGMLVHERSRSVDGLELTFAVHVAGPFALTRALESRLMTTEGSRVVWVASGGMYSAKLDPPGLLDPPNPFDGVAAYAQAKRGQLALSRNFVRRLGPGSTSVAMHPGWADTQGVRTSLPKFHRLTKRFLRTPEQGADTAAWLAACDFAELTPAGFYLDRELKSEHLRLARTRVAGDVEARLWELCESATAG